jgi:DNA-binding transcriptional LysR family regulator
MKPQINMRQIEVFQCVMLSGSVVGAAKLLNVTQPGVSRTIGLLEMRLGYALFERHGRRLIPTSEAEALYREVAQVYAGIDRIAQVAEDIRYKRAGELRIATLPAFSQWLAPRAIAKFLEERPKVKVFVQSLPSRQIAELVSIRQFDIGIVELPLSRLNIQMVPLNPVRTVALMPDEHRLAKKKKISIKDLDGERMVLPSPHSYIRYLIDDAFSACGAVAEVAIESPSSTIACALAQAGRLVTLVSYWTALPYTREGLTMVPIEESMSSRYGLIYPEGHSNMFLAAAFADVLQGLLQE